MLGEREAEKLFKDFVKPWQNWPKGIFCFLTIAVCYWEINEESLKQKINVVYSYNLLSSS